MFDKLKFIVIFSFLATISLSSSAFAGIDANEIPNPLGDDFAGLFANLTSLIRPFIILSFLAVMIYGGYLKMTAAGNAEQEEKASKTFTAGIIGFVIIVLAPLIVSVVQQLIGLPEFL